MTVSLCCAVHMSHCPAWNAETLISCLGSFLPNRISPSPVELDAEQVNACVPYSSPQYAVWHLAEPTAESKQAINSSPAVCSGLRRNNFIPCSSKYKYHMRLTMKSIRCGPCFPSSLLSSIADDRKLAISCLSLLALCLPSFKMSHLSTATC